MFAIISDLHANIEALGAVQADMASLGVTECVCLGDVIGYGPNPRECLDMVRGCSFILRGNHEDGLLNIAEDFNPRARRALEWTRSRLSAPEFPKEANYAYWDQIDNFETTHERDGMLFVHGSPADPIWEYVLPEWGDEPGIMDALFRSFPHRAAFGGHTHVPGMFAPGLGFRAAKDLPEVVTLPARAFVNVGSVGQPRDGDKRSCYVVVDGDTIRFRRVAYDINTTVAKILAIPELDPFLARRLTAGV